MIAVLFNRFICRFIAFAAENQEGWRATNRKEMPINLLHSRLLNDDDNDDDYGG